MANQFIKFAVKFGVFLFSIVLIATALTLAAWAMWIMFIAWSFNADFDRTIIIATSGFWIISGGITWAILRSRKR